MNELEHKQLHKHFVTENNNQVPLLNDLGSEHIKILFYNLNAIEQAEDAR